MATTNRITYFEYLCNKYDETHGEYIEGQASIEDCIEFLTPIKKKEENELQDLDFTMPLGLTSNTLEPQTEIPIQKVMYKKPLSVKKSTKSKRTNRPI